MTEEVDASVALESLEQKFESLYSDHVIVVAERDGLDRSCRELQSKLEELRSESMRQKEIIAEFESSKQSLELSLRKKSEEYENTLSLLATKKSSVDALTVQLEERNKTLSECVQSESNLMKQLSSTRSLIRPLEIQIDQLRSERDIAVESKQFHENEWKLASENLMKLRRDTSEKESGFMSRINALEDELRLKNRRIDELESDFSTLQISQRSLEAAHEEKVSSSTIKIDQLSRELSTAKAVIEEYTNQLTVANGNISSLESQLEETMNQSKKNHEEFLRAASSDMEALRASHKKEIERLHSELETVREESARKTSEYEEFRNSIAADPAKYIFSVISEQAKSDGSASSDQKRIDHSLQVALDLLKYSKLEPGTGFDMVNIALSGSGEGDAEGSIVKSLSARAQIAEMALVAEKEAHENTKSLLGSFVAEVEARAPSIKAQRDQLGRVSLSLEDTNRRLAASTERCIRLESELQNLRNSAAAATQKQHALVAEVVDLRKQVFVLLNAGTLLQSQQNSGDFAERLALIKSILADSGVAFQASGVLDVVSHVTPEDVDAAVAFVEEQMGSSGEVIDASLLTFKNISELLQRNQQLLQITRVLAKQLKLALAQSQSQPTDSGSQLETPRKSSVPSDTLSPGPTPMSVTQRQAVEALASRVKGLQERREAMEASLRALQLQRDHYRAALFTTSPELLRELESQLNVEQTSNNNGSPMAMSLSASQSLFGTQQQAPIRDASLFDVSVLLAAERARGALLARTAEDLRGELASLRRSQEAARAVDAQQLDKLRSELLAKETVQLQLEADRRGDVLRLEVLENSLRREKAAAEHAESRAAAVAQQLSTAQARATSLEASLAAAESGASAMRAQLQSEQARVAAFASNVARLEEELKNSAESRAKNEALNSELARINAQLRAAADAEATATRERLQQQREALTEARLNSDSLRRELDELKASAEKARAAEEARLQELQSRLSEAQTGLVRRQAELEAREELFAEQRRRISFLETKLTDSESVRNSVDSANLRVAEERVQELEAQLTTLQAQLEAKNARVEELEQLLTALESSQATQLAAVEAQANELKELRARLAAERAQADAQVDAEADRAAALEESMKSLQKNVELLTEERKTLEITLSERSQSLETLQDELRALQARVGTAEEETATAKAETAIWREKFEEFQTKQEKEAPPTHPKDETMEKQLARAEAEVLELRASRDSLQLQVSELSTQLSASLPSALPLEPSVQVLLQSKQEEVDSARAQVQQLESRLRASEQSISALQLELDALRAGVPSVAALKASPTPTPTADRVAAAEQALAEALQARAEVEESKKALLAELSAAQSSLVSSTAEVETLNSELAVWRRKSEDGAFQLKELDSKYKALNEKYIKVQSAQDELDDKLIELERERDAANARAAALERDLEAAAAAANTGKDSSVESAAEMEALKQEVSTLQTSVKTLEAELSKSQQTVEALEKEKSAAQAEVASFTQKLKLTRDELRKTTQELRTARKGASAPAAPAPTPSSTEEEGSKLASASAAVIEELEAKLQASEAKYVALEGRYKEALARVSAGNEKRKELKERVQELEQLLQDANQAKSTQDPVLVNESQPAVNDFAAAVDKLPQYTPPDTAAAASPPGRSPPFKPLSPPSLDNTSSLQFNNHSTLLIPNSVETAAPASEPVQEESRRSKRVRSRAISMDEKDDTEHSSSAPATKNAENRRMTRSRSIELASSLQNDLSRSNSIDSAIFPSVDSQEIIQDLDLPLHSDTDSLDNKYIGN